MNYNNTTKAINFEGLNFVVWEATTIFRFIVNLMDIRPHEI